MIDYKTIRADVEEMLLERFLRYVRIDTTSDESIAEEKTPSTEGQWDLIRLLADELKNLGIETVEVDDHGYIIARIPGNSSSGGNSNTLGLMAHVDTNSDAPGENIQPRVHENYDGRIIVLEDGVVLDPAEWPLLSEYEGETLITTDGTTLLGADDKAGVAEIMTAVDWLLRHPEVPRGDLEIIFTPDEETGAGMNRFPLEKLKAAYCITMDGGREGELETECYYAWKADVRFDGKVIHPGSARGKLVNAVTMAAGFVSMLPRNESPEATDGRYGNYWPHRIEGGLEHAELQVFYRSFDADDISRRTRALESFAAAVEAAFPGGKVTVETKEQYRNMREELDKHPLFIHTLREAIRSTGIEPIERPIRGGTDGSRLTAMGVPTPNVFAGGVNFHSRSEWIALPAMTRAAAVIVNLVKLWADKAS